MSDTSHSPRPILVGSLRQVVGRPTSTPPRRGTLSAKLPHRRKRLTPKYTAMKPCLRKAHQMRYTRLAFPVVPTLVFPSLSSTDISSNAGEHNDVLRAASDCTDVPHLPFRSSMTVPPCSILRPSSIGGSALDSSISPQVVSPEASPITPKAYRSAAHIQFYDYVRVKHIPNRSSYPDDVKAALWSTMGDISANARRNTIEFAADSWDWRLAAEEDDMYWHRQDKVHVHPVHVLRSEHVRARQFMANRRAAVRLARTK